MEAARTEIVYQNKNYHLNEWKKYLIKKIFIRQIEGFLDNYERNHIGYSHRLTFEYLKDIKVELL